MLGVAQVKISKTNKQIITMKMMLTDYLQSFLNPQKPKYQS